MSGDLRYAFGFSKEMKLTVEEKTDETDNSKKLAQWAMDFRFLMNGCQGSQRVVLYANSNTSFELRDAEMDRLQQDTLVAWESVL